MKKKLLTLLLAFVLMINIIGVTASYASEYIDLKTISKLNIEKMSTTKLKSYEEKINQLSDNEFVSFLIRYLNNKDFDTAKNTLLKLGVKVEKTHEKAFIPVNINDNIQVRSSYDNVDAWEVDLFCYSSSRSGSNLQYITGSWEFNDFESDGHHSTYDVVGLYWDSDKADYYDYSICDPSNFGDPYAGLQNSSQSGNGTVTFNAYDCNFWVACTFDDLTYVSVTVDPTIDDDWIDFGMTYDHTYTTENSSYSGSASITFSSTGEVTGSIGFTVNPLNNESTWEIGESNAWYE